MIIFWVWRFVWSFLYFWEDRKGEITSQHYNIILPVFRRLQCRQHSFRRLWVHRPPGTGPCWRQSADRSSHRHHHPRSPASSWWDSSCFVATTVLPADTQYMSRVKFDLWTHVNEAIRVGTCIHTKFQQATNVLITKAHTTPFLHTHTIEGENPVVKKKKGKLSSFCRLIRSFLTEQTWTTFNSSRTDSPFTRLTTHCGRTIG